MGVERRIRVGWIGILTGALLSCSLLTGTSTPSGPTTTQLSTSSPAVGQPTASPAANETTETPNPPPPTALPATPVQGAGIAHLSAGTGFDVAYVRMVDADQGWAIGGLSQAQDHVFRTRSGGQTWSDVTPPEPAPAAGTTIGALGFFSDASHAWVAYGPANPGAVPPGIRVWFTSDGGGSWSYGVVDTSQVSQESFIPLYLDFADSEHGWLLVALGAGMNHQYVGLFATKDGGKTWALIQDPTTPAEIQSFPKTGMIFADANTGWLTRDGQGVDAVAHLIKTEDGGVTWTRIDLDGPDGSNSWYDTHACGTYSPTTLSVQSLLVLVKCVDTATFKVEQDYLYSTSDGGQTWKAVTMPAAFAVEDPPAGGLFFVNAQSGMALGRHMYNTEDGGKTWSSGKLVNWDGQFSFLDLKNGWAVARNAGQIALVNTMDGGKTWQEIRPVVAP